MQTAYQFIDGNWIPSVQDNPRQGDSIDPSIGQVAAHFIDASVADAQVCVRSARRAFDQTGWARQPRLRADVLLRFADRLEAQQQHIGELLVTLNGKLMREALGEIGAGISELRYYAGLARNIFGRTIEVEPGCHSLLDREAIGVAAIIVPWNAPVTLLVRSLAPALAAGCTVVIKAAHQTALVHQRVLECLTQDTRVPAGVVNSYVESGSDATRWLCGTPEVDVISFTGSTQVGKDIARASSANLTRLSLELGGKAPAIVLADADIEAAVQGVVAGSTVMAGQMCTAIARVLVESGVREAFAQKLASAYRKLRVGSGKDPASQMGPLIDCTARDRLLGLVDHAADKGQLLVRGAAPEGLPAGGSFLTPSLVALQDLQSPLIQDELFGPLVVLEEFEGDAECAARANATRFGLAASVWTRDLARGKRLANALKSGTVWINAHNKLFAEAETGGYRESGYGRLHGVEGMNDFLETKHIYMSVGGV